MNSRVYINRFVPVMMLLVLGAVATNPSLAGNDRVSGRVVGMARTFVASSRGLDALGLNPANLALDDRGNSVTFHFAPFGFRVGSDFVNYQIYNDFFTGVDSLDASGSPTGKRVGKHLSDDDKNAILGLFPGGIAHTQFNFEITEFGLSIQSETIGGIGFSVSERIGLNFDLPEGYMKFLLNGVPEGAVYSFDNTSVTASWVREYAISYARVLPFEFPSFRKIALGVGVKIEQGFGYFGTDHYNATIENITYRSQGPIIDSMHIRGNFDFLQYRAAIPQDSIVDYITKPAGSGLGLDFGISAEVFQALRFGVSVTDIGKITWTKNTKAYTGTGGFTIRDIQKEQDTLKNAFKGRSYDTTEFKTSLPTALHFGAAFQLDEAPFISYFPGRLLLAADVHIGFNEEPGNTKTPRFALGMEYRPVGALPIRTGFTFGGRERFGWALGLGINTPIWDLDFATESIAILTNPNGFRNGSFTLGMRFRI